jgi:hypothetical protein
MGLESASGCFLCSADWILESMVLIEGAVDTAINPFGTEMEIVSVDAHT